MRFMRFDAFVNLKKCLEVDSQTMILSEQIVDFEDTTM